MKRLLGSLLLLLILAGCNEDILSHYDLKNISGPQFLTTVKMIKDQPMGIILDRQGEMFYYGAKIDEFNEVTLTGKLTTERHPDDFIDDYLTRRRIKFDVFTSQLIKDVDGQVIGLYLFSTPSRQQ